MDGWMDGSKSRVKDCLQQSKIAKNNNNEYLGNSLGRMLNSGTTVLN